MEAGSCILACDGVWMLMSELQDRTRFVGMDGFVEQAGGTVQSKSSRKTSRTEASPDSLWKRTSAEFCLNLLQGPNYPRWDWQRRLFFFGRAMCCVLGLYLTNINCQPRSRHLRHSGQDILIARSLIHHCQHLVLEGEVNWKRYRINKFLNMNMNSNKDLSNL